MGLTGKSSASRELAIGLEVQSSVLRHHGRASGSSRHTARAAPSTTSRRPRARVGVEPVDERRVFFEASRRRRRRVERRPAPTVKRGAKTSYLALVHFDRVLIAFSDGASARPRRANRDQCPSKQIGGIGVDPLGFPRDFDITRRSNRASVVHRGPSVVQHE